MSIVDSAIPLLIGAALALYPQIFVKKDAPDLEAKKAKMRKIGLVLVGVGCVYALLRVISP